MAITCEYRAVNQQEQPRGLTGGLLFGKGGKVSIVTVATGLSSSDNRATAGAVNFVGLTAVA